MNYCNTDIPIMEYHLLPW